MYLHINIYICLCYGIHTHACLPACLPACMHACVRARMRVRTRAWLRVRVRGRGCVRVCVCVRVWVCACVLVCGVWAVLGCLCARFWLCGWVAGVAAGLGGAVAGGRWFAFFRFWGGLVARALPASPGPPGPAVPGCWARSCLGWGAAGGPLCAAVAGFRCVRAAAAAFASAAVRPVHLFPRVRWQACSWRRRCRCCCVPLAFRLVREPVPTGLAAAGVSFFASVFASAPAFVSLLLPPPSLLVPLLLVPLLLGPCGWFSCCLCAFCVRLCCVRCVVWLEHPEGVCGCVCVCFASRCVALRGVLPLRPGLFPQVRPGRAVAALYLCPCLLAVPTGLLGGRACQDLLLGLARDA